ncbi:hypothetical protein JR316_0002665 [Psilocybe cubensis]|uniref:Uncharacterized protein n=2 Tax=Psilocybe cubensis TaxID=181762 RepID=A0A8H7Y5E5_PSICU|nr:hypothetical protein JR316_0002665 [Psilocybe cubensis]KAH9485750.1 hypothetical protein JR316_0002665 [Psilocybe cubensis]
MLNISRAPISEKWLSSTVTGTHNHQALDSKAVLNIRHSRFSISTINTDLFPELISWSAMMKTQSLSPSTQSFPSDVTRPSHEDSDTIMEMNLSLSAIFDPTTLEVGFDTSCFDGLDDTLIYSPMSAFADVCWEDGLVAEPPVLPTTEKRSAPAPAPTPTPIPAPTQSFGDRKSPYFPLAMVTSGSSDDSDTDSDECRTFNEEDVIKAIPVNGVWSGIQRVGEFSSYETYTPRRLNFEDDSTSFMIVEPQKPRMPVSVPNASDSAIGSFPVRTTQHKKSVSSRITAFRAHLMPGRLTFVRPPAQ